MAVDLARLNLVGVPRAVASPEVSDRPFACPVLAASSQLDIAAADPWADQPPRPLEDLRTNFQTGSPRERSPVRAAMAMPRWATAALTAVPSAYEGPGARRNQEHLA